MTHDEFEASAKQFCDEFNARLAEPTIKDNLTVEPVAVWELQESGWEIICDGDWVKELPFGTKLYTAPPERKPLTDEEIDHLAQLDGVTAYKAPDWFVELARAIERAHGIGDEE